MASHRLPFALHAVNETIAFVLELIMLFALGWWGAKTGSTWAVSALLAAGAPLAAAILWGLFAAPKARIRLPMAGVLAVKAAAFGAAVAASYALGLHAYAGLFAAVSLVNTALAAFDRDAAMRTRGG
ncbi:MAG: YrdB family protein [Polyangiaceae bacterium]